MISVTPVFKAQWDEFIITSPQYSIFSTTRWCELFDDTYEAYGCFKGDEMVGGIIGFRKDTFISGGYPITPFQGVAVKKCDKYTTQMSLQCEVSKALIEHLKRGQIVNHYSFTDIRPFLWAGWTPLVKYSYILTMDELAGNRMEKDTRNLVRKHLGAFERGNIEKFYELYTETFHRKEMEVPVSKEWMLKFYDEFNPHVFTTDESGVVILDDVNISYYLFGASTSPNKSFSLMWDAFNHCGKIDMTGANVPEISHYKRGFGGELRCYLGAEL